jgi:hypothetical protein
MMSRHTKEQTSILKIDTVTKTSQNKQRPDLT